MHDNSVPLSRVIAVTLSTLGAMLVVAAWIVGAADNWHIGIMLGLSSVPIVAAAAVSWVRCFSLRICAMLKGQAMAREGISHLR